MAAIYFQACGKCCDGIDACCDSCAKTCGKAFKPCTECFDDIFCNPDRPLPICATFTCLIQVIPAIVGVYFALTSLGTTCSEPIIAIVITVIIAGVLNMIFAMHLYRAMTVARQEATIYQTAFDRACDICMYDKGVALFIPVLIGQIIFSYLASSWISNEATCANSDVHNFAGIALMCLQGWLALGLVVIFISTLCECCRGSNIPGVGTGGRPRRKFKERSRPPQYGGTRSNNNNNNNSNSNTHPGNIGRSGANNSGSKPSLVGTLAKGVVMSVFGIKSNKSNNNNNNNNNNGGAPPAYNPESSDSYAPQSVRIIEDDNYIIEEEDYSSEYSALLGGNSGKNDNGGKSDVLSYSGGYNPSSA